MNKHNMMNPHHALPVDKLYYVYIYVESRDKSQFDSYLDQISYDIALVAIYNIGSLSIL